MRVSAVPSAQCSRGLWPQCQRGSRSEAPAHRQQLQPKSAESGLCDLPWGRASPAGPSGDVCPQRLFQAPPSRTGLGREQSRRRTKASMSTCCGCSGRCNVLPSLAVLHQKPEYLFPAVLHPKFCLPQAGCGPRNCPKPADFCKPAAHPSSRAMLDPWDLAVLLFLPHRALAVAESLFIVLVEGFVSLLPSKFPGI